jgi:hypothetical protein
MTFVSITRPGERIEKDVVVVTRQPSTPSDAPPIKIGLVEISQTQAAELIPGPVGPQGPQGPQGETGPVSTVPGPAGPVGPVGPQGIQGPKGDTGSQGPQGIPGTTGATGAKGDKGDTGATGSQGPQGVAGPQGAQGNPGPASTVPGPVGPQGVQGPVGPVGGQVMAIGDNPPASPVNGQTWWEADSGNSFIFYVDPSGAPGQWVPSHVGTQLEGGGGGIEEAPVDGQQYARSDAAWEVVVGGSGGGTTILNDEGPPAGSAGAAGDYYVDTVGQDLYGPKLDASDPYHPPEHGIPDALNPASIAAGPLECGSQITIDAPGIITHIRYRRPASMNTAVKVNIWNNTTGVRLATATIANDGGGAGWKEVALEPPFRIGAVDDPHISLLDGVVGVPLMVSVGCTTGEYSRTDGWVPPISNGGHITNVGMGYGTVADIFPGNKGTTPFFWCDVVFRADNTEIWPLAVPGESGGGGGTPGGATTQIQFNDAGAFGGDTGLTYDKTTDTLTVAGGFSVTDAFDVGSEYCWFSRPVYGATPDAADYSTQLATTAFVANFLATREPSIPVGNAALFWAGNKTWKPSFVQMTQAAYDALGTKDPNTLYVVVG